MRLRGWADYISRVRPHPEKSLGGLKRKTGGGDIEYFFRIAQGAFDLGEKLKRPHVGCLVNNPVEYSDGFIGPAQRNMFLAVSMA